MPADDAAAAMAVHHFGRRPLSAAKAIGLLAGEKVSENGPAADAIVKHGSLVGKLTAQQVQFAQFNRRQLGAIFVINYVK